VTNSLIVGPELTVVDAGGDSGVGDRADVLATGRLAARPDRHRRRLP
jgi:hypothetical protein